MDTARVSGDSTLVVVAAVTNNKRKAAPCRIALCIPKYNPKVVHFEVNRVAV